MVPTLQLTVKYANGGVSKVDVKPRSQVAFEKEFDLPLTAAMTANLRFEHMYFLAWHASKTNQPFEEWLDGVDGIDFPEVDTADPTPPVPSDGS